MVAKFHTHALWVHNILAFILGKSWIHSCSAVQTVWFIAKIDHVMRPVTSQVSTCMKATTERVAVLAHL